MALYKNRFRIESTRLPGWDYSQNGCYFVTLCVHHRACVLGEIKKGKMTLSDAGRIAAEEWQQTPVIRSNVHLDQWIIMPNHLHGILFIQNNAGHEPEPRSHPAGKSTFGLKPGSLGAIIGQFKSVSTKRIRASGLDGFAWQPRFYEHIIRNDKEFANIQAYVINNPVLWDEDEENPDM